VLNTKIILWALSFYLVSIRFQELTFHCPNKISEELYMRGLKLCLTKGMENGKRK